VIKESELLLQKEGGLDGELKTSGSICEQFVRTTLQKLCIPGQFRVTSGYIATRQLLIENKNLPQCDLLIVDKRIPPLFRFANSAIEVIPRESLCGFIEVKRSLTKDALYKKEGKKESGALFQLNKIVSALGETDKLKTDQELRAVNIHVGFHNHSSDKPLVGVIALENRIENFEFEVVNRVTEADSLVDFVWTIDGNAIVPGFRSGRQLLHYAHTARPKTATWSNFTEYDFKNAKSEYYRLYEGNPTWICLTPGPDMEKVEVFSKMLGLISMWLSRTFGRPLKEDSINDYYLRH
jgi:hypothetical protein